MLQYFGCSKQFWKNKIPVFSTGLVLLYIAGLPLRSCWTIGLPSVVPQCPFFVSGHSGIQTHVLGITMHMCYHCATLMSPLSKI